MNRDPILQNHLAENTKSVDEKISLHTGLKSVSLTRIRRDVYSLGRDIFKCVHC